MFTNVTLKNALIVFFGIFLGSIMDGIAGGGGTITVPTYMLAGLPMHMALGTNKFSAGLGITASVGRYYKNDLIPWKSALIGAGLAIIGSAIGVRIQLLVSDLYLRYFMLVIVPLVAVLVLKQKRLPEVDGSIEPAKQLRIVAAASFFIGMYDGFYGPGTGTFLLLIFCNLAKYNVYRANATVKVINFGSNFGSVITSIIAGTINYQLGIIGALGAFSGQWIGSKLAVSKGSKVVKPCIIVVLVCLLIKIISDTFFA